MNPYKEAIRKAIDEFHSKFYPEVRVLYIGQGKKGEIAFKFGGHFCLTCGLHDYFDDFAETLSKYMKQKYTVLDKLPLDHGYTGWIIIYAPKKTIKRKWQPKAKFLIADHKKRKYKKS